MVCVAAFIILALIGIFVAIISIFRRDIGRKYWQVFKKAWGCVGKKVRLQKCETNFKEDVKNSLLKKVVIKHPKMVKPLSVVIEIASIVIVFVFVWAVLTSIKALLALWVFGTCNVSHPASCALGAEACSVDEEDLNWFTEWGEIFQAMPDAIKDWQAEEYKGDKYMIVGGEKEGKEYAMDIIDPGCSACMQSYRNQKDDGFFDEFNTIIIFYPIMTGENSYKFKNSLIISQYLYALIQDDKAEIAEKIIDRIFTGKNSEGISYQSKFNNNYSNEEAKKKLENWLVEFGLEKKEAEKISKTSESKEIAEIIEENRKIIENKVHIKGIPTTIYQGRKHMGLYKTR